MLAIQRYLLEHSIQEAIDEFSIEVQESEYYIQLNYTMFNTPLFSHEGSECRGLILDKKTFEVVCYPFYRFHNEHDLVERNIPFDLDNSVLQEKLDGSLLTLWYDGYENKWQVCTRGMMYAHGQTPFDVNKTFSELFWEAYSYHINSKCVLSQNYNYIFELVAPENRVMKLYPEPKLYLLGIRDRVLLWELNNDDVNFWSQSLYAPRPKIYSFTNRKDLESIMSDFDPTEEGFVAVDYNTKVDGNYARMKIKCPRYLALSKLVNAGGEELLKNKRLFYLWVDDRLGDIIKAFPEYKIEIDKMLNRLVDFDKVLLETYEELYCEDKKEFALGVKDNTYNAILFALYNNKINKPTEYLKDNMRKKQRVEVFFDYCRERYGEEK